MPFWVSPLMIMKSCVNVFPRMTIWQRAMCVTFSFDPLAPLIEMPFGAGSVWTCGRCLIRSNVSVARQLIDAPESARNDRRVFPTFTDMYGNSDFILIVLMHDKWNNSDTTLNNLEMKLLLS